MCLDVSDERTDGSCWLHGLQDGVVLASLPLCQIYGRFVVGTEAEESLNKGGSLKYAMASASHLVGAEVGQSEGSKPIEAFTKSLSTIGQEKDTVISHRKLAISISKI